MRHLNLIAVFDPEVTRVLMCERRKPPYQGMLNFVGGKLEMGEDSVHAAYRELREETGITGEDIALTHFMDLTYYEAGICLEVYTGRLHRETPVSGEENDLLWVPLSTDFFDITRFAGEGNIGHIMAHILLAKEQVLR